MKQTLNKNNDKFFEGYLPILTLIVSILLIYSKNLGFTFSYFDDDLLILNNATFYQTQPLINVFKTDVFLTGLSAFYRPFQTTLYYLIYNISNGAPSGYFLFNMLLHIGTVLALYFLLMELKFSKKVSFWFSLIFAVNPLFVHSVSWIPSLGDLVMGLTISTSFLFFIKYAKYKKIWMLIMHLVFFIMALLSKESVILFPLILIAYFYLERLNLKYRIKDIFHAAIGWALIIIIYFILRASYINMGQAAETFNFLFIINNLPAIPELIFKFFIPLGLSPLPRFETYKVIIGLLMIGTLGYFSYRNDRYKNPLIFLGFLWLLLFILPTLTFNHQLSDISYQYLEHRAYVPFIGIIFILALILKNVIENNPTFNRLLIAIAIVYSAYSYIYSFNYKDPEKFYGRAILINSNDPICYYNRGVSRHQKGKLDEALLDYNKALVIKPDYNTVFNNRGIIFAVKNMPIPAIRDFTKGIETNPRFGDLYTNRANAYTLLKEYDKALEDYSTAISLNSRDAKAYLYRANVKFLTNRKDDACDDVRKSAELGLQQAIDVYNKNCRQN